MAVNTKITDYTAFSAIVSTDVLVGVDLSDSTMAASGTTKKATVQQIQSVGQKLDATTAPTANEDSGDDYRVGSMWIDVTNDLVYVCVDSTLTAAVWRGLVGGPASSTDNAIARFDSTTGKLLQNSAATLDDNGALSVAKIAMANLSNDSQIRAGGFHIQSLGPANGWFGDNLYYDGSGYKYRQDGTGVLLYFVSGGHFRVYTAATGTAGNAASLVFRHEFNANGNFGIGVSPPTAALHLKAGTATAGTASLKIPPGTVLTAPENGAIENDGTSLYYTDSTPIRVPIVSGINAASDGSTVTFDLSKSRKQSVTLGDNRTLALSNVKVGTAFVIRLQQDGTGGRTVTWFSTIKWADGSAPTLTTTANKADLFGFLCTSSGNYDGFVIGQNI